MVLPKTMDTASGHANVFVEANVPFRHMIAGSNMYFYYCLPASKYPRNHHRLVVLKVVSDVSNETKRFHFFELHLNYWANWGVDCHVLRAVHNNRKRSQASLSPCHEFRPPSR